MPAASCIWLHFCCLKLPFSNRNLEFNWFVLVTQTVQRRPSLIDQRINQGNPIQVKFVYKREAWRQHNFLSARRALLCFWCCSTKYVFMSTSILSFFWVFCPSSESFVFFYERFLWKYLELKSYKAEGRRLLRLYALKAFKVIAIKLNSLDYFKN